MNFNKAFVHAFIPASHSTFPAFFSLSKALRFLIILFLIFEINRVLYVSVFCKAGYKESLKKILLVCTTLLSFFLFFEGVFSFIAKSHQQWASLAQNNWRYFFHQGQNSLGYRDKPVLTEDISKRKIVVVGDSFTAGDGLKNVAHRFSEKLESRLPDSYRVFNLGIAGNSTTDSYKELANFPHKPDVIVLQYFGTNMLEEYNLKKNVTFSRGNPFTQLNFVQKALVQYSYLLNYVYFYVLPMNRAVAEEFRSVFLESYRNEKIMESHLNDLNQFVELSKKTGISLIVVLFPFLNDASNVSQVYMKPIESFFEGKNIPTLNVSDLISEIPLRKRTVHKRDSNPSALVHKKVGEELYRMIKKIAFRSMWVDDESM
ncbi:MAG: SGNH/GDSL hydrolase family protein [Nitrospinota bacterium]